ncbi:MAG: hypothetical protein H6Q73_1252 [Firmicutes bacterium]|nr:hypothetical protein [Bacillota bacterium]
MLEAQIIPILLAPLTPSFAMILILAGLYSLTFNITDARRKNHRRAENLARIGGWLYILSGIGVMLTTVF